MYRREINHLTAAIKRRVVRLPTRQRSGIRGHSRGPRWAREREGGERREGARQYICFTARSASIATTLEVAMHGTYWGAIVEACSAQYKRIKRRKVG